MNLNTGIQYKGTVDIKLGNMNFRLYNSGTQALSNLFTSFLAGYTIPDSRLPQLANIKCIRKESGKITETEVTKAVAVSKRTGGDKLEITFTIPSTAKRETSIDDAANYKLQLLDNNKTTLASTIIDTDLVEKLINGRSLIVTWYLQLVNAESVEQASSQTYSLLDRNVEEG